MTGVEVIPISGVTCEQPRVSLVVSPAPSAEVRQRTLPVTASSAYTLSCSVTAYKTLCVPSPGIERADT